MSRGQQVRTTKVLVEVEFTITDRASEGEILDWVLLAMDDAKGELTERNGRCEMQVIAAHVTPAGEPGGNL